MITIRFTDEQGIENERFTPPIRLFALHSPLAHIYTAVEMNAHANITISIFKFFFSKAEIECSLRSIK